MSDIKWSDKRTSDPADPLDGTEILVVVQGGVSKGGIISDIRDWLLAKVNVWTKNQSVAAVMLTSGTSVAVDATLSNNFKLVLSHNATLSNPSNLTDGMVLNVAIKQDGAGSRTLAFDTKWVMMDGSATAIASGIGKFSILSGYYDATDDKIYFNLSVKA